MEKLLLILLTISLCFAQRIPEGGVMRTDLRQSTYGHAVDGFGVLPATDPYLGTITVKDSLLFDMVDWVLVRIWKGNHIHFETPACLLSDGSITDTAGNLIQLPKNCRGNVRVEIRHRNHLAVINDIPIHVHDTCEMDFTTGQNVYENNLGQTYCDSGWAMVSGDGDGNGYIQTSDRSGIWVQEVGMFGYLASDYDLNAFSQTNDRSGIWVHNVGKASQVLFLR